MTASRRDTHDGRDLRLRALQDYRSFAVLTIQRYWRGYAVRLRLRRQVREPVPRAQHAHRRHMHAAVRAGQSPCMCFKGHGRCGSWRACWSSAQWPRLAPSPHATRPPVCSGRQQRAAPHARRRRRAGRRVSMRLQGAYRMRGALAATAGCLPRSRGCWRSGECAPRAAPGPRSSLPAAGQWHADAPGTPTLACALHARSRHLARSAACTRMHA